MPTRLRSIADAIESWAPPQSAQSYDNVGLQVGRADAEIRRAVVALDMTPQVLDEARRRDAQLIVTHHPLLFRPLKRLTPDSLVSSLALSLAESGIALYAAHTNLDAARGGVSFALAGQLGLENVEFLQGMDGQVVKLVTFVPPEHAGAVRTALGEAGAGRIGRYDHCAFTAPGTGHYRPGEGTDPYAGESGGDIESADEIRIEAEVARWDLPAVLSALRERHPYEEPAYDVIPVDQPYRDAGIGAVGDLPNESSLGDFLRHVCTVLENPALRYAGEPAARIRRVAVCGGSGSSFLSAARSAGADVFVTADVTYHTYFDVLNTDGTPRMALVDAGHYETERITETLLTDWLSERFPDVDWIRTDVRTAPVATFVPD
ncbi:MAG: Nif3-like dinuclear metal center hexameric protein [Rhodothermales bacterium]|nr:Nif3-like dinuclear metal center hexameric protein [Rhodothermales bacterium]